MIITKMVGNKEVKFVLTNHAVNQFALRLRKLHQYVPDSRILPTLIKCFMESKKLKIMSKAKVNRDNKYNSVTTYYRTKGFNFVVVGDNNTIVTIELNGNRKYLNRHTEMERRLSRV